MNIWFDENKSIFWTFNFRYIIILLRVKNRLTMLMLTDMSEIHPTSSLYITP